MDTKQRKMPVLWIGIVLMPIRSRISILMPIHIWNGTKTMPVQTRILPHVLKMLEKPDFFFTFGQSIPSLPCFYLSRQCQICHNFQYFGQHIQIFWKELFFKKVKFINFIICLGLIRIRIGRIRIRIGLACNLDVDPDPRKWWGSDPIRIACILLRNFLLEDRQSEKHENLLAHW